MSATATAQIGDGFDVRSLAVTYCDGVHLHAHDHPWGQLLYAISGVMRLETPSAVWFVPATKAIWIPADHAHEIEMKGQVAMRTLYLAPHRVAGLASEAVALEVAPLLRELILHILKLGMLDARKPDQDRLAGLLVDLLAAARREDLVLPLPRDSRAVTLAQRLQADPADGASLASLAESAGASLRTLQRLFPEQTGLSLDAWRQKARLIHAVAALTAGASVTNAAMDCGYDSVSAFIGAFRKQFGVTPGRYRSAP